MKQDSYRHKGLRQKLVDEIRSKGITDDGVLKAINTVPRHLFMESSFLNFSYKDAAFPIGAGQTISQPYTVAFQTQLLQVEPFHKVLEIGTGSGYQTAILLELGAKVFTIERQKELYLKAKMTLEAMGYHPHFFYGDGYLGLPTYGPFDRILVTAGAPEVPQALIDQLKEGGRLVAPVGDGQGQDMMLVEKFSDNRIESSNNGRFIFVPLLRGTNNPNSNGKY